MRIISGKYKGRRINPPKNLPVRPTTDMTKEALFNVLNNHFNFSELQILELFAGTGSISYEFASRGCAPIIAVDGDMGCVNFIKKTAKEFDFDITAIKSDVFKFLEKHRGTYDIIFADPPYDLSQADFEKLVTAVFDNELLDEAGMLIVEHSKYTKLDHMAYYSFQKNYGGSVFSFFEFEADEEVEDNEED
ncbi:RsmD family RNA methyltransferase [Flavobacterium sedimenticola]|uniref:RsmD family RNA methyltransferase n=1 Tax=Flavobacterium sedimenticola TaxID=3043286 RepID=A0ABT6XQW3_9FLAO|nr:RsmD family RNA methyltransferase [Flavobacterium sedimenticola]MDI9257044.1 RsmD family RNA methyltransferase [Flavobacterium sedimenticola]